MVTWVYIYVKNHQAVHLKCLQLTVYVTPQFFKAKKRFVFLLKEVWEMFFTQYLFKEGPTLSVLQNNLHNNTIK